MKRIFLCHASKDKPFVRRLAKDLEFHGLNVWLDEHQIFVGDSLSGAIETGLDKSDNVIVVLSRVSLRSAWVQKELRAGYALEIERRRNVILPVLLQKTPLPLFLRDKKYADFSHSYDAGLAQILSTVFGRAQVPRHQLKNTRCSILLDIVRLDGSLVRYSKAHTIKCIKGEISQYVDTIGATGTIHNIRCTPGTIATKRLEGEMLHLTVDLPRTLTLNQSVSRTLYCDFKNTFIDPENYWEEHEYYRTDQLSIAVRFPRGRPPSSWEAYGKNGPDIVDPMNAQVRLTNRNGNPCLLFCPKPSRSVSSVVIRWTW